MNHYKSWSDLNKQLSEFLCDSLKGRISYFLTRYHEVHNSYGRAAIMLDKKELVVFSWKNTYVMERDVNEKWKETGVYDINAPDLKEKWDKDGTISDWDFLQGATDFLQIPISDALISDNYLIRVFAILDRRLGKRTLRKIYDSEEYKSYPEWVQQFYKLRFEDLD